MQIKIENPATQKEAIQWFIEHRHSDVSVAQAIRTLRFALSSDRAALSLLDQMEREFSEAESL